MEHNYQNISYGPDVTKDRPVKDCPQIVFLKNSIHYPFIIVGEYTYYDDCNGTEPFEKNIFYKSDHMMDKLIIGRFCSIARGISFFMNGANHRMNCCSTYPFHLFPEWGGIASRPEDFPYKGDIIVGNDVWIGKDVAILPGTKIGDGAIIGANSVVSGVIPTYSIAVGNPCKVIKKRFDDEMIFLLLKLEWWNRSSEWIYQHLPLLQSENLDWVKNEIKEILRQE